MLTDLCHDGACNQSDEHLWLTGLVMIAVLKDIVLIPVHTQPWDSERELDELYEVFLVVKDKWKTDVSCIILFQCFSIKVSPENRDDPNDKFH